MAKIKNIFPHVGVSYHAAERKRVVTENNSIPTLFAPFISERGPENIPYKVYNNAEFLQAFGTLNYTEQGQQVLNIGNWLNSGGAVLAYRMTKVPTEFIENISAYVKPNVFSVADSNSVITVNGIVTDNGTGVALTSYEKARSFVSGVKYFTKSEDGGTVNYNEATGITAGNFTKTSRRDNALYTKSISYEIIPTSELPEDISSLQLFVNTGSKYVAKPLQTRSQVGSLVLYQIHVEMTPATEYKSGTKYYMFSNPLNVESDGLVLTLADMVNYVQTSVNSGLWVEQNVTADSFCDYYVEVVTYGDGSPSFTNSTVDVEQYAGNALKVVDGQIEYKLTANGNVLESTDTKLLSAYYQSQYAVIKAKYSGNFYNEMMVRLTQTALGMFRIDVLIDNVVVESFSRKTLKNYRDIRYVSDYIGDIYLTQSPQYNENSFLYNVANSYNSKSLFTASFVLTCPGNGELKSKFDESMIGDAVAEALKDKLSIKADYMLDAGYKAETKQDICDALIRLDGKRDDIIFISDCYKSNYEHNEKPSGVAWPSGELTDNIYELRNLGVYEQYLSTEDIYSSNGGAEVYVTPTYFLAGLIPYNELNYGAFLPTAGKKRGVINDALSLNENPSSEKKDEWYEDKLNYIERDSQSIQFMSQSTYTNNSTALKYLNNSRTLNKICRDIEQLGRNYLFEDSTNTTIRGLQNAVERYLSGWMQNRALTKAECEVYADENDDTLVHVIINIRFAGIIEIISVEINID